MNKVYVVQRPAYYCKERRGWVNKYDISPALVFGSIEYVLKPGNIYKDELKGAIAQINIVLEDFTENDYILAIGDPVAIAATVLVACKKLEYKKPVKMLKYDRIKNEYSAFEVFPTC